MSHCQVDFAESPCCCTSRRGLPDPLRRSPTWAQGVELAQHARLRIDAGVEGYFCHDSGRRDGGPAGAGATRATVRTTIGA